jgi:hypothetical protein
MTARKDWQDRIARTEQPGWNSQVRTDRNGTAGTGKPVQYIQDRTARTGQRD